jgi:hypothetical protein
MAVEKHTVDQFSISGLIARSEERIARQRQIVEDLRKFNASGPAERLLAVMEQTLAELRTRERGLNDPPQPVDPQEMEAAGSAA